ncbi:MAG TPA: hypothetical protein VF911_15720 [Thermoanaerobaculia bacterium]|jgi:hypothetical protein
MALITELKEITKDRQAVHGPVECAYSVFTGSDGERYLQLETFGSKDRKIPGKTSQAIQLSESSAAELKAIIEQTFPSVR